MITDIYEIFGNWIWASFAIPVIAVILANFTGLLKDTIPNEFIRGFVLIIIFFIPVGSLSLGIKDASRVISGKNYRFAIYEHLNGNSDDSNKTRIKFIGKAGDYFFFSDLNNSYTIIKNLEDIKELKLYSHKTKRKEVKK